MTLAERVEAYLRRLAAVSPPCVLSNIGEPLSPRSIDGAERKMAWFVDAGDPLEGLSDEQRTAAILRYGCGRGQESQEILVPGVGRGLVRIRVDRRRALSDGEIARIMGTTETAVRRLLRDASRATREPETIARQHKQKCE